MRRCPVAGWIQLFLATPVFFVMYRLLPGVSSVITRAEAQAATSFLLDIQNPVLQGYAQKPDGVMLKSINIATRRNICWANSSDKRRTTLTSSSLLQYLFK